MRFPAHIWWLNTGYKLFLGCWKNKSGNTMYLFSSLSSVLLYPDWSRGWFLAISSGNRECSVSFKAIIGGNIQKTFLCLRLCVAERPASLLQPTSPCIVTPAPFVCEGGQPEIGAGFEETVSFSYKDAALHSWGGWGLEVGTLPLSESWIPSPGSRLLVPELSWCS